jgi:hypothetical protein
MNPLTRADVSRQMRAELWGEPRDLPAVPVGRVRPRGCFVVSLHHHAHRVHIVTRAVGALWHGRALAAALTACGKALTRPHFLTEPSDSVELCDDCALADFRQPTVYRLFGEGDRLLYVGATCAFDNRIRSHANGGESAFMWPLVRRWTTETYPDMATAFAAERVAIDGEAPVFNENARLRRSGRDAIHRGRKLHLVHPDEEGAKP